MRGRLEANGWGGTWVWQVFAYHHYHPNAHEALAVVSGHAELMLGGRKGQRVSVATFALCRSALQSPFPPVSTISTRASLGQGRVSRIYRRP